MADQAFGISLPSKCDILAISSDIRERREASDEFKALYDDDKTVRGILGRYGIGEDVQTELLRNDQRHAAAADCMFSCFHTCWFTDCTCTGCCITQNS